MPCLQRRMEALAQRKAKVLAAKTEAAGQVEDESEAGAGAPAEAPAEAPPAADGSRSTIDQP